MLLKKRFVFVLLALFAISFNKAYTQTEKYSDTWEEIKKMEKKGRYKTALQLTDSLFQLSWEKENTNQIIKTTFHKIKYKAYFEEDDFIKALMELRERAPKAPEPAKQIMFSVLGELYSSYYSSNRYKFTQRTSLDSIVPNDIRTWSLKNITAETFQAYEKSLSNRVFLQKESIEDYEEIVLHTNKSERRPTLFDLLSQRALNFYVGNEISVPQNVDDNYTLTDERAFLVPELFQNIGIPEHKKYRYQGNWNAIRLYQDITRFHVQSEFSTALLDWTALRLDFVKSEINNDHKDTLHFEALKAMIKNYGDVAEINEFDAALAEWYKSQASDHNFFEEDGKKDYLIRALEIARRGKDRKGIYGRNLCSNIEKQILRKSISLNVPMVVRQNEISSFLIRYKNMSKVYMKIIPYDYESYHEASVGTKERIQELNKMDPLVSKTIELTDPEDYYDHSMEYILPELDYGHYVLMLSSNEAFTYDKEAVVLSTFQVSNLELNLKAFDGEYAVLVTERIAGNPLNDVNVRVNVNKYSYTLRKYVDKKVAEGKTGKDGFFSFTTDDNYNYTKNYILSKGKDKLYLNNYSYNYNYNEFEGVKTTLFTDRKIYRPGQTIYFKGIVINHKGNKDKELVKNSEVTVEFLDNNSQLVKKLKLKTNDFGSYTGSFTAPMGVNTGSMRIRDQYRATSFSVEEYKRPKFEVSFEPIENEVKLNEKLTVTGIAKAYAGYPLDGAHVQYRIVRRPSIPSWAYRRWGWFAPQYDQELENGTTKTDAKGNFDITFEAIPDQSISEKYEPVFTYTIYADVTDLNGETHSAVVSASEGYRSMNLYNNLPDQIVANKSPFKLKVSAVNLNGTDVNAEGGIIVQKMITPGKFFKSRSWSRPHYSYWSKEEYEELFPYINYGGFDRLEEEGDILYKDVFNTTTKDSSMLPIMEWKPSKYILKTASKDKEGNEVKKEDFFHVIDPESDLPANDKMLSVTPVKSNLQPGDQAELLVSSIAKDVHVYYEIFEENNSKQSEWIELDQSQKKITYDITEASRGNVTFQFYCSRYGKTFQTTKTIYVSYLNKQLETKFTSFRDELRPGQKEKWSLKIQDKQNNGAQAELLTSMYDASLDAFRSNGYGMYLYSNYYKIANWSNSGFGINSGYQYALNWNPTATYIDLNYPTLDWSNRYNRYGYYGNGIYSRSDVAYDMVAGSAAPAPMDDAEVEEEAMAEQDRSVQTGSIMSKDKKVEKKERLIATESQNDQDGISDNRSEIDEASVQVRTNFNETAFFYPQLMTNDKGEVSVEFTVPESLTEWKFIGLAHTKDLKVGSFSKKLVTKKELMVVPNPPRFFREGDLIYFSSKIVNLSDEDLEGKVTLNMLDPFSEKDISSIFKLSEVQKDFTVKAQGSTVVEWKLKVPFGKSMAAYKVIAQTKEFSDGEQKALPILSNRMLVTESLPLPVKGKGKYNFEFKKLKNNSSRTLKHHRFTLEFTNNPAWYAIQAMPYMMEYPYECNEQTFTRYYSNKIATHIVNSNPKIQKVFEAWKNESKEAFLSNLQKNEELKQVLLEETPWVLQAQDESERKKRVGLLFDLNKMSYELNKAFRKLQKAQKPSGGWPWFEGMRESRYITQHIVTGFGKLSKLGVLDLDKERDESRMVLKAIGFLDEELIDDYEWVKRHVKDYKTKKTLSTIQIHYLYGRTFFLNVPVKGKLKEAFDYYREQAKKYWTDYNLYTQGLLALIAHRTGEDKIAQKIVLSLGERSLVDEEMGMYWKDNRAGYYWYQAPIETQALMIEVFDEVAEDRDAVKELKVWLLKNKQTNDWKTTKATAEACYALLMRGTDLLANDELVDIKVGSTQIVYNQKSEKAGQRNVNTEAGTGYFKTSWSGDEVQNEFGDISVTKENDGVAWGAAYWQYFEDMDKITFAETNVSIKKDVMKYVITDDGPVLKSLKNESLEPGDKVKLRVEIRSDREMDYVHMKDMRASGLEPVDVFSRYKYQDGLGYYQATKDAATHFFFDHLPKGTFVFEYDLKVYHKGDFSNGVTTLQCMYAPEFTTHSAGIRLQIGAQ